MKNKNARPLLLLALLVLLHPLAFGDVDDGVTLPGRREKTDHAVKKAECVVLAHFTKLGMASTDAPGRTTFEAALIAIDSTLYGNLSGMVEVEYSVGDMENINKESLPLLGSEYIMFVKKEGPSNYTVTKLLDATTSNIETIKKKLALKQSH